MSYVNPRVLARLCLSLTLVVAPATFGQDLGEELVKQTDAAFEMARSQQLPLLSPGNFEEAEKYRERAQSNIQRGRSIDKIKTDLTRANSSLQAAEEVAKLARVTFASALKARQAAVDAQSSTLAKSEWEEAEKDFDNAARRLEDGDVNRAKSGAAEAKLVYREAELVAIQGAILNEARRLIAMARADKVERGAPISLTKAETLVSRAEADLKKSRYRPEEPRAMAREAEYEARHAMYLAKQAGSLKSKQITAEELILSWETPLIAIAKELDSSTDLSNGYAVARDASLARIQNLEKQATELTDANARVAELELALGITTERAEASELRRRQIAALESLFSPGEAQILREGNRTIIRLIGLQFDSGQAVIQSGYFGLLRKIADVPDIFPGASLVVEGHTDSVGADQLNWSLSERRANSVRDYLLANTVLGASRIVAVGYGESRPIANNETAQGRGLNRRIDVVVVPSDR
ncbi:MAG: OmpA family protein [Gammaproteobacteria bacterium]